MNTEKLRKGCTKGCLIYFGLSVYGLFCAGMGAILYAVFTGHDDCKHHDTAIERTDSAATNGIDSVSVNTTAFEVTQIED